MVTIELKKEEACEVVGVLIKAAKDMHMLSSGLSDLKRAEDMREQAGKLKELADRIYAQVSNVSLSATAMPPWVHRKGEQ